MAQLKKSDTQHIANLAKLNLTDEEIDKFTTQLSDVVSFISELSEVDVEDIEPTSQTTGLENIYRQDEIKSDYVLPKEKAISGTDKTHNGYFVVDAILSERTDK